MGCVHSAPEQPAAATLHSASEQGRIDCIENILAGRLRDRVRELLATEDEDGRTPLFLAVENARVDAVAILLDYGADVNHVSRSKGTVLLEAVMAENFHLTKLLLDQGANPFLKDSKGITAWDYALANCQKAGLLREFENQGLWSGHLRFPVPVKKMTARGCTSVQHCWRRKWVVIVPEFSMHLGEIYTRRLLYIFDHSASFRPQCVAELDGATAEIASKTRHGTTVSLVLDVLPDRLEGIFSMVETTRRVTLYMMEFPGDGNVINTALEAISGDWGQTLEDREIELGKTLF